jgi:hypothetical protein
VGQFAKLDVTTRSSIVSNVGYANITTTHKENKHKHFYNRKQKPLCSLDLRALTAHRGLKDLALKAVAGVRPALPGPLRP